MLPADLAVPEAAGAACLLCRLSTLPLAYFPAPIPPAPFPAGRGGFFLFSYARGFAPCIPGTEPEATREQGGEPRARRGACLPCCRLTLPFQKPQGQLAFFVACQPCLQLTFFPPSPRPALAERSSPAGRGRFFCFLMQGASPLASPGLSRKRHWDRGANHAPSGGGACLPCCRLTLPFQKPQGRLAFFVACQPCL